MAATNGTHTNGTNAIPGPLGIESASLKGKVALVTGAGIFYPTDLYFRSISHKTFV